MSTPRCTRWTVGAIACLLQALVLGQMAHAAGQNDLVVMLRCPDVGDEVWGAGILVHHSDRRAIVVTTVHNVGDARSCLVELFSARGREFPAEVIAKDGDEIAGLDLAVLELPAAAASPEVFAAARQALLPEGAEIVFEHGVIAVGNPGRRPWFQNVKPEAFRERLTTPQREDLRFESSVADRGISGGGLFSEHGALLGMVQRYMSEEGGARALSIRTIARRLAEWKIPFSLEENPEVLRSASRRVLADLGLASAAGLRRALEEEKADFGLLHLFWLAGLPPRELACGLGSQEVGCEGTLSSPAFQLFEHLRPAGDCVLPGASRVSASVRQLVLAGVDRFASKTRGGETCAVQVQLWFEGLVRAGLDPDLVVGGEYYPREALLAAALTWKNAPAMLALLNSGASPNPYQELAGTVYQRSRLLDPLWFLARDFVGAERDALRRAFVAAGVVVSKPAEDDSTRDLPPTPSLADAATDPICERATARYDFDWCGYLHGLSGTVRYQLGSQKCDDGYCPALLTHALFVSRDFALLLAVEEEFGRRRPVVVQVPRAPGQWYADVYDRNYGCRPPDDGSEPDLCWRTFLAWPASYRAAELAPRSGESQAGASASVIDHMAVEGIFLAMPLTAALAALESRGYTTETMAAEESTRDSATTRDYRLESPAGTREITVIAVNESIRGLRLALYDDADSSGDSTVPKPSAPDLIDLTTLKSRRAELLYYAAEEWQEERQTHAVDRTGIGRSYLAYRRQPAFLLAEVILLRRAENEAAAERAFFERWLDEWLGPVELATSGSLCVDRYAHIRDHGEPRCLTAGERAASFLAQVKSGGDVRQLASGLSYEVLAEGKGPRPSPEGTVTCSVTFRYLDDLKTEERLNGYHREVGNVEWPDIKEALIAMKEGSRWRLYVPPGIGSNDSRYLQLTEIHLEDIGD